MKKDERYSYTYAAHKGDGIYVPPTTVKYTVLSNDGRFVHIRFDNGALNHFSVGSPMELYSVRVP